MDDIPCFSIVSILSVYYQYTNMSMKVILCAHAMHTFCPHFDYFSLDGHTAPALFLDLLQEEHLGKVSKLQLLLDLHTPPMWHRRVEYPAYKHRHNEGLSFLHAIWRGDNRHKTTPLPLSSLPPLLSPLLSPPSPLPSPPPFFSLSHLLYELVFLSLQSLVLLCVQDEIVSLKLFNLWQLFVFSNHWKHLASQLIDLLPQLHFDLCIRLIFCLAGLNMLYVCSTHSLRQTKASAKKPKLY